VTKIPRSGKAGFFFQVALAHNQLTIRDLIVINCNTTHEIGISGIELGLIPTTTGIDINKIPGLNAGSLLLPVGEKNITINSLCRFCKVFGCRLSELLAEEGL